MIAETLRAAAAHVVVAVAILTAPTAALAQSSNTERGETLVKRHCGGCHATGRTGVSREPAAPPLRELHRRYEPEMLAEALAEGILSGHPAMPSFRFGPNDVGSIILYLNAIQVRQKT
jgi:cytochrome c